MVRKPHERTSMCLRCKKELDDTRRNYCKVCDWEMFIKKLKPPTKRYNPKDTDGKEEVDEPNTTDLVS